jgi:hypothetical protein
LNTPAGFQKFQANPYVSEEVKNEIQGKMKKGDKLLKQLNQAYSKIVWPIKAEDIIEGYEKEKIDGDLLEKLINDPTIMSNEEKASLFTGFAAAGQSNAIKQFEGFVQNSKGFGWMEKSEILQLQEKTTDQNKTAIDSAIDMVIDSITLMEVKSALAFKIFKPNSEISDKLLARKSKLYAETNK